MSNDQSLKALREQRLRASLSKEVVSSLKELLVKEILTFDDQELARQVVEKLIREKEEYDR